MHINLCLVVNQFFPVYSGAAIRFQKYAPGLREREVDMHVFTASLSQIQPEICDLAEDNQSNLMLPLHYVKEIPVKRVQLFEKNALKREMAFAHALVEYCENSHLPPDVIQSLTSPTFLIPWLRRYQRLGIPYVASHTLLWNQPSNSVKRITQHLLKRVSYNFVDCVITSSLVAKENLRLSGVRNRIEVICNGVDTAQFKPVPSESIKQSLRNKHGIEETAEVILFVGPMVERKGIDTLLKTWKFIAAERPNAYLVMVGPDYKDRPHPFPEFAPKIKDLVTESGAADRLTFVGKVEDVQPYYHLSDIMVFPSRREGMPNVVLEAYACGLATVITPFLGLSSELGHPGQEYVLSERDPELLGKTVIELLNDISKCHELGYRARKWAEIHLDLKTSLDRYASLYHEMANRNIQSRLNN